MFIIDDLINAWGANQAAQDQEQAADQAMAMQRQMYSQARFNEMPFWQTGQQSLAQLYKNIQNGAYNVNLSPQTLANDPGYKFQMQQGQQALERSAAARGGLNGGGFMKALDQYSQGLASTQYQNAWNRQFQQNQANFGQLYGLAGMGQGAANSLAQLGTGFANSMSGLLGAKGNAQAAGAMGIAKGVGGAIGDAGSLAMFGMGGGFSGLMGGAAANGMADGGGLGMGGGLPSYLGNYNLVPPQNNGSY